MVKLVVENVAVTELLSLPPLTVNEPAKVADNEPVPLVGAIWLTVNVKLSENESLSAPDSLSSPKLMMVGVRLPVEVTAVYVTVSAPEVDVSVELLLKTP